MKSSPNPFFTKVRLALRLLVDLLLLPLPVLFLFLVIIIIGTLCYEMTSLTAFKVGALSPCFVLVGVLLVSFQCGLEALDDKRPLIFIETRGLHLCHLAW
jgi:hypothetical protein